MNNGLLLNSSNAALRYNSLLGNLVVGDGDAARSAYGTGVIVLGENNSMVGHSDNSIVLGSGNNIDGGQGNFGKNNGNIVLGVGNSVGANTSGVNDGGNVVIGTQCVVGTFGGGNNLKARNVVIGNKATVGICLDGVSIGSGANSGSSNGIAIGTGATNNGGISIGQSANTSGGIAIGPSSADNGKSYSVGFYSGRPTTHGAFCMGNPGALGAGGASQIEIATAYVQTSDATITELLTWTALTGRMVIPNDTTWGFTITVVGRNIADDSQSKMMYFKGAIRRGVGVGTTTLVGTPSTDTFMDTGTESWGAGVSADTTNGALKIVVYGATATNIRWFARVDSVQITG